MQTGSSDPPLAAPVLATASGIPWRLVGLLLFALLIRTGVVVWRADALAEDIDGYRWLSKSLATTGLFGAVDEQGVPHPTAFRPPLYPWVLSWCVWDGELSNRCVAALHVLLGLFTTAGTYGLATTMLNRRAGWLAGLLVAIDPILLIQSTLVMTETLATALAVATWLCWNALFQPARRAPQQDTAAAASGIDRPRIGWSLALACCLVAAFFCRPTFLIWAVLLCGWLGVLAIRRRQAWPLITATIIVLALVGSIGLWTMRNVRQLGHPIWATSHGGYTLLLGNNPPFYDYLAEGRWGVAWDAEPFHRAWTMRYQADPLAEDFWQRHAMAASAPPRVADEVADDALAYQAARETIRRQPDMFVWSCIVRLGRLWSPLPHRTAARRGTAVTAVAGYYLMLFTAVLVGGIRHRKELRRATWVAGILLAIAFSAVHLVYWSNMRMRAPVTPLLALLAAPAFFSPSSSADE